ncbi:MAG: flagellar basal body rod protein FlgB [Proteobacteria bacterium]|nr:flagellar basal body rod protein FlgB [Pseudomonadota bacterium]
MGPADIPLLTMLKGRMGYLANRQRLIAENVANSDTPGFAPRDLKPFTVSNKSQTAAGAQGTSAIPSIGGPSPGLAPSGGMAMTQSGHMDVPNGKGPSYKTTGSPDSEMTIDRNGVVLEDQMIKLTDTRMDYDAAISFYQASLGMLKTAIKKPGS